MASYVNKETKTDGPAKDTRANRTRNVRPLVTTERRLAEYEMVNSEPNAAMSISENTGENEGQVTHVVDEAMVAAIEGIVNKLQHVAVGVGSAHQNYAVNKFDGITEDADLWLQKFERYARLQNLIVDH